MKPTTAIALPDIHVPYQDKKSLRAVEQFMSDTQPNYIIYTGDQMDLEMLMKITKNIPEHTPIHSDYEQFDAIMTRHMKLCPKAKIVFIEGNHEERVRRLIEKHPTYAGSDIELERYFQFKKRGIEFIPFGKTFKLGKLYYMHGNYYGIHHAKKTVSAYGRSIIYGHTHDFQAHTMVTPLDVDDAHVAKSIGCLCTRNPNYKKGAPNRWVTGFHIAYFRQGGYFNDHFIKITRGKFIYGGKVYG